jgi:hypothetical protein
MWLKSNCSVTADTLPAGWNKCRFDREYVVETNADREG